MNLKYATACVFCLVSARVFSQGLVEGTWVLDVDMSISMMDADTRLRYDTLPPDVKARGRASMENREFQFTTDGIVVVRWKAGTEPKESSGTWTAGQQDMNLVLTIEGGTFQYTYEKSGDNILILKSTEQGGFFSTLYFNKSS